MALLGIDRRLRRLGVADGRFFLLALDHGLAAGPLPGIERPAELIRLMQSAPCSALIANPGMVRCFVAELPASFGLVVHLSASTLLSPSPTSKVLSSTVEDAAALGADAVSVQISFGDSHEDRMIADAGGVVDAATSLGLPVLVMAYARVIPGESCSASIDAAHAARAAADIGASLVQTNYLGDFEGLRAVVTGCPAPVIMAGGPASSPEAEFFKGLGESIRAGAMGVAVGRRIFQAPDPVAIARRIAAIVFDGERSRVVEAVR